MGCFGGVSSGLFAQSDLPVTIPEEPVEVVPVEPNPTPIDPIDFPDWDTDTPQKKKKHPKKRPKEDRIGAVCKDGTSSNATGGGACSGHGGVKYWVYKSDPTNGNPNPEEPAYSSPDVEKDKQPYPRKYKLPLPETEKMYQEVEVTPLRTVQVATENPFTAFWQFAIALLVCVTVVVVVRMVLQIR